MIPHGPPKIKAMLNYWDKACHSWNFHHQSLNKPVTNTNISNYITYYIHIYDTNSNIIAYRTMHRTSNNLWISIENISNVHENTVHNQCLQAFQEIFNECIFSWKCWLTSPLQRCKGWVCGDGWCGSIEEGSSGSICSCYPRPQAPHWVPNL